MRTMTRKSRGRLLLFPPASAIRGYKISPVCVSVSQRSTDWSIFILNKNEYFLRNCNKSLHIHNIYLLPGCQTINVVRKYRQDLYEISKTSFSFTLFKCKSSICTFNNNNILACWLSTVVKQTWKVYISTVTQGSNHVTYCILHNNMLPKCNIIGKTRKIIDNLVGGNRGIFPVEIFYRCCLSVYPSIRPSTLYPMVDRSQMVFLPLTASGRGRTPAGEAYPDPMPVSVSVYTGTYTVVYTVHTL